MEKKKINVFETSFIKTAKDENIEELAEKTWRNAESALKSNISNLEGDSIDFEDSVENAEADLNAARVNNGEAILDRPLFIANLVSSKNYLTNAQDALKNHLATLEFLKKEYASLKKMASK